MIHAKCSTLNANKHTHVLKKGWIYKTCESNFQCRIVVINMQVSSSKINKYVSDSPLTSPRDW